jgi:hypothetical protein
MATKVRESDPEGLGPDIWIASQRDEHEDHEIEPLETLYDNGLEYTEWFWCRTCSKEFMYKSVSVVWG